MGRILTSTMKFAALSLITLLHQYITTAVVCPGPCLFFRVTRIPGILRILIVYLVRVGLKNLSGWQRSCLDHRVSSKRQLPIITTSKYQVVDSSHIRARLPVTRRLAATRTRVGCYFAVACSYSKYVWPDAVLSACCGISWHYVCCSQCVGC